MPLYWSTTHFPSFHSGLLLHVHSFETVSLFFSLFNAQEKSTVRIKIISVSLVIFLLLAKVKKCSEYYLSNYCPIILEFICQQLGQQCRQASWQVFFGAIMINIYRQICLHGHRCKITRPDSRWTLR